MNNTYGQVGYRFTEKDLSQIRDVLERVHRATGITVSAETGDSAGFAAAILCIDDAGLRFKGNIVTVQSWSDADDVVRFGVLAVDKQPVGPDGLHDTFIEALVFADLFLRRVLEDLIAKRANEQPAQGKSIPAFAGNVVDSSVLSPEEVHYVQSFANELGRVAGLRGFANFVESRASVMSIALGVMNKADPIMLGSVVVVSNDTGSSCSVRDFKNRPMPGPDYYGNIYAALVTTRPFFEKLAQLTAKHVRPSLLTRIFG